MKRYAVCLEDKHKNKILSAAAEYDLIVVDAQDFTGEEIKKLKKHGAQVLSYINVGAVESGRSYFDAAKKSGLLLAKYDNWPGEYWVAAQTPKWRSIILGLATTLSAKGIDGFWVDNLDILYTAEEEFQWSKTQLNDLFTNLQTILTGLHKEGYVMINGGDVFVTRAIKARQAGSFDGINQETVFTCIKDYDPPGKFGRQSTDEREYYEDYLQTVRMAEKDICLLEYATDSKIIAEAQAYARAKGYTLCISGNIELGGDIRTEDGKDGGESMGVTPWDMMEACARFEGSPSAHTDTLATVRKYGHHPKTDDAWCTMQLMAIFYTAGGKTGPDMIGGYEQLSRNVKKNAEKKGQWVSGTSGLLPFYPVIFGKGTPNHSELSMGYNLDLSGNYNGGTGRRTWRGRNVAGYVKVSYTPMPAMNELQLAVVSSDVILGVYGSGATRKKQLAIWGAENAARIQAEVDRVWGNDDQIIFNMAVAAIAGFMGKNEYRKKRLGSWADKVQKKINAIYAQRGKSIEAAADLVWAGAFGKGAVRERLLEFCGYDPEKVQAAVNKRKQKPSGGSDGKEPETDDGGAAPRIDIYAPRFWENDPERYGDCTAFIEYAADKTSLAHVTVVDPGMKGTVSAEKLQKKGIKEIEAIIISHDHSDHYGLTESFIKKFKVGHVYLPPQEGVKKYQPEYPKRMEKQAEICRAAGVPVSYYNVGDRITVGHITFDVLFQTDAEKLPEKESHHFINNMSPVIRATINGRWRALLAGDLSKEGIKQLLAAGIDVTCHIFKILWHGDRGAITEALVKALKALVAYSQYHAKEGKGNARKATYDLLRDAGTFVVRAFEDGDIDMLIDGDTLTVTGTKGVKKTFKI